MRKKQTVLGIIGGMGSLATIDLMNKIVLMTAAKSDKEHIPIVADLNTQIPDRTEAIVNGGETPLYELARSAIKLESMGADVLLIACNTAHYFYDEITNYIRIPIVHMIEETALYAQSRGIKTAGLLATEGTVKTGIYEKALNAKEIKTILPSYEGQKTVMTIIYDVIKAGKKHIPPDVKRLFIEEIKQMKASGAGAFVLGCTELPIAVEMLNQHVRCIDPTVVLAAKAITLAGKQINKADAFGFSFD